MPGAPAPVVPLGGGPNRFGNLTSGAIGAGAGAGFFDPMGSPAIRAMLQRRALRTAQNRMRRGSVLGRLAGLDPMSQRQSIVDLERETGGDISDFLNRAQEQELLGNRDYIRALLSGERGYEFQTQEAERQRKADERMARWGALGSLVGKVPQFSLPSGGG